MSSLSSFSSVPTLPVPLLPEQLDLESLRFDERGLLPVVVQGIASGAVLMVAWADSEAVEKTLESGLAHFWSRSRQQLWRKGETSGNELVVTEVVADCDRDTLLYRAHPKGPTCHLGSASCFEQTAGLELGWLAAVVKERERSGGAESYTRRLLDGGLERVAQKVGEEAVELAIAATSSKKARDEVVAETADLLYHLLVLLQSAEVDLDDVAAELARRHRESSARSSEEPEKETGKEPREEERSP